MTNITNLVDKCFKMWYNLLKTVPRIDADVFVRH